MRQLDADPAWVEQNANREARWKEKERRAAADEASIIAELAKAGVNVSSVYDFINDQLAPPEAIPILVRHLNVDHLPAIREG